MSYLSNSIRHILVNKIASSAISPGVLRNLIYAMYGIRAPGAYPGIYFTGASKVTAGDGTWINRKCYFNNAAPIEIGNNCGIGMEVMFCTSTHELGDKDRRAGKPIRLPIRVGNGCWIGTRATILPGVNVGEGCVIAAGAVVTKDCEPNGLYAGVPAKRIKDLT